MAQHASRNKLSEAHARQRNGFTIDVPMNDFVICINNDGNSASLIVGKVYRTLPDEAAEPHDMIRVIDEDKSEPDGYLYPASMFVSIELPEVAERALMATSD
jgi:hypothetical protein